MQINTTNDERDRSNPFRFANIGVEKFLELNSEQNHDDYCLAYVFTDRDFDDGVLGLAWVGAPAGTLMISYFCIINVFSQMIKINQLLELDFCFCCVDSLLIQSLGLISVCFRKFWWNL